MHSLALLPAATGPNAIFANKEPIWAARISPIATQPSFIPREKRGLAIDAFINEIYNINEVNLHLSFGIGAEINSLQKLNKIFNSRFSYRSFNSILTNYEDRVAGCRSFSSKTEELDFLLSARTLGDQVSGLQAVAARVKAVQYALSEVYIIDEDDALRIAKHVELMAFSPGNGKEYDELRRRHEHKCDEAIRLVDISSNIVPFPNRGHIGQLSTTSQSPESEALELLRALWEMFVQNPASEYLTQPFKMPEESHGYSEMPSLAYVVINYLLDLVKLYYYVDLSDKRNIAQFLAREFALSASDADKLAPEILAIIEVAKAKSPANALRNVAGQSAGISGSLPAEGEIVKWKDYLAANPDVPRDPGQYYIDQWQRFEAAGLTQAELRRRDMPLVNAIRYQKGEEALNFLPPKISVLTAQKVAAGDTQAAIRQYEASKRRSYRQKHRQPS